MQLVKALVILCLVSSQVFATDVHTETDVGATCSTNCQTCTSPNVCTSCKTGYYLKYESCFACGSKCATCSTNTKCKLCIDGYHLNGGLCYPNQKTTGLIAILVIAGLVITILLCRVCRDCKHKNQTDANYQRAVGTVPTLAEPHYVNVHQPVLPQYMNPLGGAQAHTAYPGPYNQAPGVQGGFPPSYAPNPHTNPASGPNYQYHS